MQSKPVPETLIEMSANNQSAWVLCVGEDNQKFDEIYFKGPSGEKIKVIRSGSYFPGYITEYSYVNDGAEFKAFSSSIFYKQNLPVPVIYSVNGKFVAGFGDSGSSEAELVNAVVKEFNKLPMGFQQALREFYLFGDNATIGVSYMAAALSTPLGEGLGLKPYDGDEVIETNLDIVKAFKAEFNKCDPK